MRCEGMAWGRYGRVWVCEYVWGGLHPLLRSQTDGCPPTGTLGSSPSTLLTTGLPATSLCPRNPPKPWQSPWGTALCVCVCVCPAERPTPERAPGPLPALHASWPRAQAGQS